MALSAKRVLIADRQPGSAFTERERRWLLATELPVLVCALAAVVWVEPQRELSPLICGLLVVAYAVACQVHIALPDRGDAPSTQLIFVPMLLLVPLNLVPLLVLAGNTLELVALAVVRGRPLPRAVLALGNSAYALAPVLVLAADDVGAFSWTHWPVYLAAIAAGLLLNALYTVVRLRLQLGKWIEAPALGATTLIDVVLSIPALGIVAVAAESSVAAALMTAALLAIASGFTSERSQRVAERERAAVDARRALVDERVRIARELHDVVAHHVSVIGVQAGAARLVLARDPDKARETLGLIESSSRQAVHELHRLLGFLRQADDPEDLGPQPGLARLDELTTAVRDSQLVVDVQIEGEPFALAPTVDASAYRIVQEALTNTLKHARASRVEVRLRYRPGELELEISDDGEARPAGRSPGGHGLIGMRERAALHGGQLTTGPGAGGGFVVRATLPAQGAT